LIDKRNISKSLAYHMCVSDILCKIYPWTKCNLVDVLFEKIGHGGNHSGLTGLGRVIHISSMSSPKQVRGAAIRATKKNQ
jgi:hypothetical protein